ncbi:pyridoxamine 5'-phosphate oxidase-related, FMN- binding [Acidimicrobium ferrooxidans DSM 10331]|uniref:Pyridoxamine 5'-phosphate oxidase-related, FMN-binding n=1 Tax=Acidimicrobium ferrooxidans (strain DSM 10331 / JCM 15462 / NBRC 103882 / ICP) TaxID=525909 RepID=C7LZT1_ACIFD|nr:pyridoxamine 5'-phosphate oxidase-related, FMN- binding [Acidimicrobium ferrooxidans DSM 10331]
MRTDLTRERDRRSDDRAALDQLLDEELIAHVAVVRDHGPVVVPTAFARDGDALVLHGSVGSGWMRHAKAGGALAISVAHLDGLIVARSAFHSSLRYRSAVLFGTGTVLEGKERERALDRITDKLLPGRTAEVRRPLRRELLATMVLRVPIVEWSLKVSAGWPSDEPDDLTGNAWAGVIHVGAPTRWAEPAPDLAFGVAVPVSVRRLVARDDGPGLA